MRLLACSLQMDKILRPDIFDNNNTTICDEKYVLKKSMCTTCARAISFLMEEIFGLLLNKQLHRQTEIKVDFWRSNQVAWYKSPL